MLKSEALKVLESSIAKCYLCEEISNRREAYGTFTVPGEGSPNANIMVIGEAPGENEENQGKPFVGRAGNLLTNIIEATGLKRDEVFITNILKCRPPGNRDPEPEEAKNCRKYLDMQIRCIDPEWILCFGRIASMHILDEASTISMGAMRGQHEKDGRKILCTYHPSYLLRNPAAKKDVFEDLKPIFALQSKNCAVE